MIYIVPSTMAATNRNTKPRTIVFTVFDLVIMASCHWWLDGNGTGLTKRLKAFLIVQRRMNKRSLALDFS